MPKVKIVNVRLPDAVVKQLDSLIQKNLYTSRSEIIREFLREYVQEQNKNQKGESQ